jgi:putative nucleotidyltransferase with HDIG domain
MRKAKGQVSQDYKIAVLDDEKGIIDTISVILMRSGYACKGFTDPVEAVEAIRTGEFDMLILDYLMEPFHGDEVVRRIREFNSDIYVLMLTGHKDIAPPLETIRTLDIQGYCEKSDKFDQLILLIESGIKCIRQIRVIKSKVDELNVIYEALETTYLDTIEALRLAVDAKDVYTRGHSDRVAYYAVKIGEAFNLSSDELETLRLGGIFHDVGKIGTADDLLFKTEALTDKEYNEIKKHTLKGANILSAITMFKPVIPLVKCHHERIDGRGYPEGLKYEDIPFLARILSVADAFDAMTSDRLYRSRLEVSEAKKQLLNAAGLQFDADIVNKFINILSDFDNMKKEISNTYE